MPASNCCMPLCTYNFQYAKRQSKVKKKDQVRSNRIGKSSSCNNITLMQDTPFMSLFDINLNSYSKMKVNLARDVLSEKVGNALLRVPNASGTSKFVLLFDKRKFLGGRERVCSEPIPKRHKK
uniref:uncharacterized protein LOC101243292 isoform X3 n=1 Tax=Ciona intestinalis TaxID=7719 RepID=UPI000EF4682D|nr:uncharacterized protein LOC101243292 isoform X3 [Ciona intestinalis]|eukprot:XP_026695506.1 uncharacterized protein LOC101243292 isoform X3 [Ciona intestinalis]